MKTWTVYTVDTVTGNWCDPRPCDTWEAAAEVIRQRCINGGVVAVVITMYS